MFSKTSLKFQVNYYLTINELKQFYSQHQTNIANNITPNLEKST